MKWKNNLIDIILLDKDPQDMCFSHYFMFCPTYFLFLALGVGYFPYLLSTEWHLLICEGIWTHDLENEDRCATIAPTG